MHGSVGASSWSFLALPIGITVAQDEDNHAESSDAFADNGDMHTSSQDHEQIPQVLPVPLEAIDNKGIPRKINQRCLVVAATFMEPSASLSTSSAGGKLTGSVFTLTYGNRDAYIKGLQDVLEKPMLTMSQEFSNEQQTRLQHIINLHAKGAMD